jgi:nucleotide-binding universal stress UspA family protein
MQKILFPSDFSEAADNAFLFALNIARGMQAELVVCHAYQLPDLRAVNLPSTMKDINESIGKEVSREFNSRMIAYRKLADDAGFADIRLSEFLQEGDTLRTILHAASLSNSVMIIMGTTGAGMLKEVFLGSVAGEVMENATCPVLAIPRAASFKGSLGKIAVTTNYLEEDALLLKKVMGWASLFNAKVYCIHVDSAHTDGITHKMDAFKAAVPVDESVECSVLNEFDLEKAIVHFVQENNIDIVAMLAHRRSFFKELFQYSLAKAMSYHTEIPILAFQAEMLK